MQILVVDDEAIVRETLRRILENEGHEVTTLPNGNSIIRGAVHTDLLITDIVMPGIEGLETIRYVRQHAPEVGIIAISGSTTIPKETYLGYASQFGADCILTKPFYPRQLLAAVNDVARRRNLAIDAPVIHEDDLPKQPSDAAIPWNMPLL